jgi:hypothetical protein
VAGLADIVDWAKADNIGLGADCKEVEVEVVYSVENKYIVGCLINFSFEVDIGLEVKFDCIILNKLIFIRRGT